MPRIDPARWSRLSPLLDELMELDAPARANRLAELRAGDAALADELAALLAEQGELQDQGFLEGDALAAVAEPTLEGRRLGAYTLRRLLGSGGMGSVWLAERSDGRFAGEVAIKLPNLGLLGGAGQQRFLREGRALARLAHPNIARLLDAGVSDDGQPYLVIERIDGAPIDRWCDERALDIAGRLRLVLQVCDAVSHAHANLVLHRDLKPANILVDAHGVPKLLDFGIARLMDDGEANGAEAVGTTQRAFTPEYAAPEQVQGAPVSTATDVYALGVLLFNLLGGGHPTIKPAQTPLQRLRSIGETEAQRLSTAPACTSDTAAAARRAATPRRLHASLRGDLDTIVAKALKKEPAERYASVAALAEDIRRHLDHLPVLARPDSLRYRGGRFVRRHRLAVGAASATLLALLAGITGTAWQAWEAQQQRDRAQAAAERAQARASMYSLMLNSIGSAGRPLTQREMLQRTTELIRKQYDAKPEIAIGLLLPIAGQYLTLGDTQAELEVMELAAQYAERSGNPAQVAQVACDTVETDIAAAQLERAQQRLDKATAALAAVARPDRVLHSACAGARADLARAQGRIADAIAIVAEWIAQAEANDDTRGNTYPKMLGRQRDWERQRGNLTAAFDLLNKQDQWSVRNGQEGTLDHLAHLRDRAGYLALWGEWRDGRPLLNDVLHRWRTANGDAAPPDWLIGSQAGFELRLDGPERALRTLQGAITLARERQRRHSLAQLELIQAHMQLRAGRDDEAQAALDRIEPAALAGAGSQRLSVPLVRAQLLLARGQTDAALQSVRAGRDALPPPPAQSHLRAEWAVLAANAQLKKGDAAAAQAEARIALAEYERIARDPARSADVGESLLLLARAQAAAGDAAAARASAARAAAALAAGYGERHGLTEQARQLAR
ncbi:MAG: protein kinase domain-containing protein [Aquabacterium sp.]